jgi:uncharacterized protein (TIGR02594 family)
MRACEPGLRGLIVPAGKFYANYEGNDLMRASQRTVLAVCSIAFSVAATSAFADITSSENPRSEPAFANAPVKAAHSKRKARAKTVKTVRTVQGTSAYANAPSSFSSSSVVAEARRYIGTNPTNRRSLWCGAFMNMVLQRTGHKPGGNLARGYASYGQRVSGPQVGALAIMSRGRGGGHVGVVSGIDANGNVIVVSGNHNNTVAESVYPRGRIFAYVMPGA